jgi:hypothetical protein
VGPWVKLQGMLQAAGSGGYFHKVLTGRFVPGPRSLGLVFGRFVLGVPCSSGLVFGRFVSGFSFLVFSFLAFLALGVLSSFLEWSAAAPPTVAGELWLAGCFKGYFIGGFMQEGLCKK